MKVLPYRELKPKKGIPWTKYHLSRLEDAGKFPQRLYLGSGTCVWLEREIDEWIEAKAAERDTRKRRRSGGAGRGSVMTA